MDFIVACNDITKIAVLALVNIIIMNTKMSD